MLNPYYFSDRNMKVGFKINLDSHHLNHAISILTITPNYPKFRTEVRYIIKIKKDFSLLYARLMNQYKLKYRTFFQQDLINKMKIIFY